MDRNDEKDGGINPLFQGAFSEAALDAPIELVPQHLAVGGKWSGACGAYGSNASTEGAVTCPECKAIVIKRQSARAKRAAKGGRR